MRRFAPMLIPLAALLLPGADKPTREQAALARAIEGRIAGKASSCISANDGATALQIVDDQTISYRSGATIWVSKLRDPCPGMRPFDTLIVEIQGAQYCRGDRFRTVAQGSSIPGALCVLGDFTPWRRPK